MYKSIILVIKAWIFVTIGFTYSTSFATSLPDNNYVPAATHLSLAATTHVTPVVTAIPAPPVIDTKSYILIDAHSGYIMAEKNAHLKLPPASLTKIMTLYIAAQALSAKKIHPSDLATVSEKAWRTGGSRMFIQVGSQVAIADLIKGIATVSGNDATVALAEYIAGSETTFAELMNQTASALNMTNTNFFDSSGFNNNSTAFDLAILARAWILNFPEYYPWFKEKWFTYNNIKQPNRNSLLWSDASVDGMKTGLTEEAGHCLVASAERNGMRLISIIMGAKNEKIRAKYSTALLNYGFRFFATRKLFTTTTPIATPKIRFGKENNLPLGVESDLYVTTPAGQEKNLKANIVLNKSLNAPIAKGQTCGELNVMLDKKVMLTKPLIALKEIPRANWFFIIFDYIGMWFNKNSKT